MEISIHAPARGATGLPANTSHFPSISIHAPARGATNSTVKPPNSKSFQSTLPRGERRFSNQFCRRTKNYFNPRSREGSDEQHDFLISQISTFQSTLPRGERPFLRHHNAYIHNISIHAPARGATDARKLLKNLRSIFQSTLPRGERRHCYFSRL